MGWLVLSWGAHLGTHSPGRKERWVPLLLWVPSCLPPTPAPGCCRPRQTMPPASRSAQPPQPRSLLLPAAPQAGMGRT